MAKATTAGEVKELAWQIAGQKGITPEEAFAELEQQFQMVCFMGMWDNDQAEVIVPDEMPVAAFRFPAGVKIYA